MMVIAFTDIQIIIMGNSVVGKLKPGGFDHTKFHPGTNLDDLLSKIKSNYLITYSNSILFISTGPVGLTVNDSNT